MEPKVYLEVAVVALARNDFEAADEALIKYYLIKEQQAQKPQDEH